MSKKAVYGILIAVLLPLVSYLILKKFSDNAVVMPRHFIYDSVVTGTKNGKEFSDTVWHRLPDFSLTNQLGQQVSWKDIQREVDDKKEGKIVVADFFFTHCPNICPTTTRAMRMLQDGIRNSANVGDRDADFVQYLSFSVDPERDTVPELKKWSDRFQVNPEKWWLLTGDKKAIYDLSNNDLKLWQKDGGDAPDSFVHTDFFILIDKDRHIRGYYHSLHSPSDKSIDTANLARLANAIVLLSLEKDPKRKSFLTGNLELIAIVFSVAAIGFIMLVLFMQRERKTNDPYSNKER